ncbi:MAG: hypothetical protein KKG88_07575 [Proteobacteria bacterium]|jgi:hypothetical protein|nr:hypothetical protein [Pseudomonadota bacterium]
MKKKKFVFPLPYPGQSSPLPGHFDISWPREKKDGKTLRESSTKKAAKEVARSLNQWLPLSDYTARYHPATTTKESPDLFWNSGKLSGQYALDRLAEIFLKALTINIVLPFWTIPLGHIEEERKTVNEWATRLWPAGFPKETWQIRVGVGGYDHFGYESSEPGQLISFVPRTSNSHGLRICDKAGDSRSINFFRGAGKEIALVLPKNLPLFCKKSPYQARAAAVALRHLAEKIEALSSSTDPPKVEPHKMAVRCIVFAWWVKAGGTAEGFESLAKHLKLGGDARGIKAERVREKLSPDLYLALTSGVFSKGDTPEYWTAIMLKDFFNIKG